ncbi:MAG: lectin like domain-containing protein [Ruminococcus flavefaciens]|nr:lectin like domain-containing protein [Ruminococcus flavefaciens]
MKKFLNKALALITAVSLPAVYGVRADTEVSATETGNQNFSLAFPDFDYIIGQNDGKPIPVANGSEYTGSAGLYGRAVMPSSFDMRENGTISSVKDQKTHGTCWAHSSASSAESSIISSEPSVNLSELHTAYYAYYGDDQIITSAETIDEHLDWGGATSIVANLWSQWIGPVREEKLPYENTAFFEDSEKTADMQYESDFHLENAYLFDFNADRSNADDINNLVKQFVYSGNSVDVSFYHDSFNSYNSVNHCVNSNRKPRFANHAVTIAGWDDDFPADNFSIQPEHDGAWLVKNSWGYGSGEDGYIWISYEDKSLSQFAVYELGDKNNYSVNYHHDTFIPTQLLSAHLGESEDNFSYMANIFTAEDDMQIDAVSTYFQNASTEYEVTIYTGLSDETDPSSGTPSAVTYGYEALTGYRTIELSESVPVKSGEKFGVVMKLSCEDNPYVIPVESSLFVRDNETGEITDISTYASAEQIENNTNHNESFYSADGENWSDVFGEEQVYTEEEKAVILEMLKSEIYDGITEDDEEELLKADMLYASYKELFASGDLCITVGNVSLKAFGNPSGTVKFSHDSGAVPLDEAVVLSAEKDIFVSVNGSEYVPYTEPIEITGETTISAYTDPMIISERTYTPAKASFNDLCYQAYESGYGKAQKVNDSEYIINAGTSDYALMLYPVTSADITMNGSKIKASEYTDIMMITYGETTVTFELEQEGKMPDTVTLKIIKNPVSFSLEDESISFPASFKVTTEDGTVLKNGSNVGEYAGQTVTVTNTLTLETLDCEVPEREVLPELKTDYYYEMLGFIPNATAELLEYSVIENPTEEDYVSAQNRLVDGTWINSGMVMNKALRVIPSENITLRVSAGNGMFASEPVVYSIPEAVSAPEEMPEFTEKNGKFYLSGYDYEVALADEYDITGLAEKWGYSGTDEYMSALGKRFGIDDMKKLETIAGSEWRTDYALEKGQIVAVRHSATDSDFASECKFITVGIKKGDVNDDGFVDAVDSSLVLMHYADLSTNGNGTIEEDRLLVADYNDDGLVDAVDATAILMYYAEMSTQK